MKKVKVEKKCKCSFELSLHEKNEKGKLISRSPKCEGFIEDEMCKCGHYKTSHDIMERCHFYIYEDGDGCGSEMCKCNQFKLKDAQNP